MCIVNCYLYFKNYFQFPTNMRHDFHFNHYIQNMHNSMNFKMTDIYANQLPKHISNKDADLL